MSSSARDRMIPIPIQHFNTPVRYSQQLACELETEKRSAVVEKAAVPEARGVVACVRQPQSLLRTRPGRDDEGAHDPRCGKTTGGGQPTGGASCQQRQLGSFGFSDDASDEIDLQMALNDQDTRDSETRYVERCAEEYDTSQIEDQPTKSNQGGSNSADTGRLCDERMRYPNYNHADLDELSRMSLNDFIANVTIPPPPSPPPPSPPPGLPPLPPQADQFFTTNFLNDVRSEDAHWPVRFSPELDRNHTMLSSIKRVEQYSRVSNRAQNVPGVITGDATSPTHAQSRLWPTKNFNLCGSALESEVAFENDFAELVTPPPPPLRRLPLLYGPDSAASFRDIDFPRRQMETSENGVFYPQPLVNAAGIHRANATPPLPSLPSAPASSPLPPSLVHLPPVCPKRPSSAVRSPNLGSNSLSTAVPGSHSPPLVHQLSRGLRNAENVGLSERQKELALDGCEGASVMSEIWSVLAQNDRHSMPGQDCDVTTRRSSFGTRVTTNELAHSRVHNSWGTLPRNTPPPPPPRLTSSVNSSPVAKRHNRRVSFELSSTTDSDHEPDTRRSSGPSSSLSRLINVATGWVGGQRQTAEIRPNAIRSSSSSSFQSVVQSQASCRDADGTLLRATRSSSVGEQSTKNINSLFSALRSKLRIQRSPSLQRRKSSLQDAEQSSAQPPSSAQSPTTKSPTTKSPSIKSSSAKATSNRTSRVLDYELEIADGISKTLRRDNSNKTRSPGMDNNPSVGFPGLGFEQYKPSDMYVDVQRNTPNTFNTFTGKANT